MQRVQLEQLIADRPRAYVRLTFQQVMFWLFLIIGVILFAMFVADIAWHFFESSIAEYYTRLALEANAQEEQIMRINDFVNEQVIPMDKKLIAYKCLLSFCFFALARYSQKVLNRDRYILSLEEEISKRTY